MDSIDIDQKLYDFLSGSLAEAEVEEVKEWLEADEKNRFYFQQYKADFLKIRWGLRASLVTGNFEQLRQTLKQRHRFRVFRNIAAVLVLLLGIGGGLFLYRYVSSSEQPVVAIGDSIRPGKPQAILELSSGKRLSLDSLTREVTEQNGISICVASGGGLSYRLSDSVVLPEDIYNRLIIPKGGEYMMQLADGSKVWLNAATEFRYPVVFAGEQRKVFLKGEAYFEVTKDSLHPFIVIADDIEVKVYGTKFDVNNYRSDQIQTVLVEGAVGMKKDETEIRLKPGQKGETKGRHIDVTEVDVVSYIAWKDGDFIFDNERLENIMDQISRWYDVDICYRHESSRNIRLSGDMKRYREVQSLLYYFERISEVRFTIQGRTIVVE